MKREKLLAEINKHPVRTLTRTEAPDQFDKIPIGKYQFRENLVIPDHFDGRIIWQHLLTPALNQGSCGSCWAFATTSTLSDRFNIQSKGKLKLILSPTKPLLCSFEQQDNDLDFEAQYQFSHLENIQDANVTALLNGSCMGNTLYNAWKKLYLVGSNPISCLPYNQPSETARTDFLSLDKYETVSRLPLCSDISGTFGDMCADVVFDPFTKQEYGTPARFYRCLHFYTVPGISTLGGSEYDIRKDIYIWGPVSTGIDIYEDFYQFDPKTTIYKWDNTSNAIGGHAVEIVGWGEENGTKYWWIKNSWGQNWGISGYFRMVRGVNMCGIEENVISAVPDFFYSNSYDINQYNIWAEDYTTQYERLLLSSTAIKGGGLDPENGYSRRVGATKPWVKLQKPIAFVDLPVWDNFVAGIDSAAAPTIPPPPWYKQQNPFLLFVYVFLLFGFIILIKLYFTGEKSR